MKVTCEYCGSYVEVDENNQCPNCNAALGDAVRAEEERLRQEEAARQQQEAEQKAQEAKQEQVNQTIRNVASVAGTLLGVGRHSRMRAPQPPRNMPSQPPAGHRNQPPQIGRPAERDGHRGPGGPGGSGHGPGDNSRPGGRGGLGGPGGRRH